MKRTKYPRTMNFPWSDSNSSDDVWWKNVSAFEGKEIVMTEKLDGECTTIYPDGHVHARSLDSNHHPSRSWIKALAAQICRDIPEGYRICGENLYAYHSIFYTELPSYFFVYGIYNGNICISWDETTELCELLELETVPVIYKGIWNEKVPALWKEKGKFPTFSSDVEYPTFPEDFKECSAEGYVIRLAEEFPYSDFGKVCAKYVRPNHVQTDQNWMSRQVISNQITEK